MEQLYNHKIEIEKESSNIFVLDKECDFEKYLIEKGYVDEIKAAFIKLHSATYLEGKIREKDGTKRD